MGLPYLRTTSHSDIDIVLPCLLACTRNQKEAVDQPRDESGRDTTPSVEDAAQYAGVDAKSVVGFDGVRAFIQPPHITAPGCSNFRISPMSPSYLRLRFPS